MSTRKGRANKVLIVLSKGLEDFNEKGGESKRVGWEVTVAVKTTLPLGFDI